MPNSASLPHLDPLALLHALVGQWQGPTRTWFEPESLTDESTWQASIQPAHGGQQIEYEYVGTLQGAPLEGRARISFEPLTQQIEMAWFDSFHQNSNIMRCTGHLTPTGFSVLGSYHAPTPATKNSEQWGWRTIFDLVDRNQLTVRCYNIDPNGTESLGIETRYTRNATAGG